jgi:hypothetical protein
MPCLLKFNNLLAISTTWIWITSHYIGPRVSKYAQMTQSKVNYHSYPSGCQVIIAFIADDFAFFDDAKC